MEHISSADKIVYGLDPSTKRWVNSRIYHVRPAVQRPDGEYRYVYGATKYRTAGEISRDGVEETTRFTVSLDNLVSEIEALRPDVPSAILAVVTNNRVWPMFYWVPVDELGKIRVYRMEAFSLSQDSHYIELPEDGAKFCDGNGNYDGATWQATCHWDVGSAVTEMRKLLNETTREIKESVARLEREEAEAAAHGQAVRDRLAKFQAKQKASRNKEAILDAKWNQLSMKEKASLLKSGKPATKR